MTISILNYLIKKYINSYITSRFGKWRRTIFINTNRMNEISIDIYFFKLQKRNN